MPENPFRDLGHDVSDITAGRWRNIGPDDDRIVHAGNEDVAMDLARKHGRPPGDSPYVPVGEIPDWNSDPASTYEDRHAQLEKDETSDVVDLDEESSLARGTRETDEEKESLSEVLQESVDQKIGAESPKRKILGRKDLVIKGDKPSQTPKYKTELTHLREKDN